VTRWTWPIVDDVVAKLRAERAIDIGNGVFSYKFAILPGRTSCWLFKFYEGVELMTFAVPPTAQRDQVSEGGWPSEGWLRSSVIVSKARRSSTDS
jgi:hypothetical protein